MRKADYAKLASIIRAQMLAGAGLSKNADTPEDRTTGDGMQDASRNIGTAFAHAAHVDGPAFLKACGINP
jgi:hypothetical protein